MQKIILALVVVVALGFATPAFAGAPRPVNNDGMGLVIHSYITEVARCGDLTCFAFDFYDNGGGITHYRAITSSTAVVTHDRADAVNRLPFLFWNGHIDLYYPDGRIVGFDYDWQ